MNAAQVLDHFDRISEAPDSIPRLRRFVLDLAVRGKLVEQDPNDEPASELLNRIEAERARLMKEAEIRKQELAHAVEVEEQEFQIPTNWKRVRFGSIADFSAGRTPSRHDLSFWNTGDYPWVSIADMKHGGVIVATKETVSEKAKNHVFRSEPAPVGTLIMSFKLTIGKISRLGVPAFHNEAIISIRPFLSEMDAYLFMVLPQFSRQGDTKDAIKGATLNRGSIASILVPLPPLAEQHRIVVKVDELMALCDQLETAQADRESKRDKLAAASLHRLNNGADADEFRKHARFHLHHLPRLATRPEHIQQLRQTILNLAVRGKLVPQDPNDELASEFLKRIHVEISDEQPFQIPESWAWVSVGQIADCRLGKMLDKAKNKGTPRRYLRNVNVRWFDFDLSDVFEMRFEDAEIEEFALRDGDVLICEGGEPGRAAVWDRREKDIYFQKAIHRVRFFEGVDPHFFVNAIRESADSGRLSKYFTGVGIKHFTGKGLSSFVFPLPPIAEEQRIVAKVDELMTLCDRLDAQLTTTQTQSRRILETVLHEALNEGV